MIKLFGVIGWDILAEDFIALLESMSGDVTIHLDSEGGDVFMGVSIYNAIRSYNKGKVTVVITGLSASAASYIALAADEIHIYDNSSFMIHNPHVGIRGDAKELLKKAEILKGIEELYIDAYVKKTSKSRDEIALAMDNETYYFGSKIFDVGFADIIIDSGTTNALNDAEILASSKARVKICDGKCKINRQDFEAVVVVKNKFADEVNKIMESVK